MLGIVQTINAYLSDYVLVFLLVAVGVWYTVKTRFVQVRCLGEGLKGVFGNLSLNGGKHGGGAALTPEAEKLLAAYERYCKKVREAAEASFTEEFREFL